MDNVFSVAKIAAGAIAAGLTWLFGPSKTVLIILLVMLAIDYLTGLCKAWANKELSSRIGARGIIKKVMVFAVLAVAAVVDKVIPLTNGAILSAVSSFYILNEALSILENAAAMGLPIPPIIRDALHQLELKNKDADKRKNKADS